jgi:predicted CoA-binding protein
MLNEDRELREILTMARTIAVVGIKQGYRIVPVNPKLGEVLGEPAVSRLGKIEGPIDIVNLFRASEHIPAHADEILAMSPLPSVAWMQLGIQNGAAATRLLAAGIRVVQDRCIMVDHRRLLHESAVYARCAKEGRATRRCSERT